MSAVFADSSLPLTAHLHRLDAGVQRHAVALSLLEQARASLVANDLCAFTVACDRWLRHTHGIARGDDVLASDATQHIALRLEDVALSWEDDVVLEQPVLWFYGPTLMSDGVSAVQQWNRLRHDARIAKLARHGDTAALAATPNA